MTKKKSDPGRLPWAQWDFDAWTTDAELSLCSMGAQGFWMRLLAIAWKNDGYVIVSGKAPSARVLAALTMQKEADVSTWLAELVENGVASLHNRPGVPSVIYSRRLLRDFRKRTAARENGAKGGNPALVGSDKIPEKTRNGKPETKVNNDNPSLFPQGVNLEIERERERESESRARPEKTTSENRLSLEEKAGPENMILADYFDGEENRTFAKYPIAPERRKANVWHMAKGVLEVFGSSKAAAGKCVGEMVRDFNLDDDELGNVALRVWKTKPTAPRPFAIGCARQIARERDAAAERKNPQIKDDATERAYQRRYMAEWVSPEGAKFWDHATYFARPGDPGCRIFEDIQIEFGFTPWKPKTEVKP